MSAVAIPGEDAVLETIITFVSDVCGISAFRTQESRVPEPGMPDFVMMTPGLRLRLSTNVDGYDDCQFTASIANDQMTVTAVQLGAVTPGRKVFGIGVADGTKIISGPSGGGPGVYTVSPGGQSLTSRTMAAGVENVTTPTDFEVQLDVYGPASSDNAQAIASLFRDEYGTSFFAGLPGGVQPLYTSEPTNAAFVDEEQQYQGRWTMKAHLQADFVVQVPKQFAAQAEVTLIDVDVVYPVP